MILQKVAQTLEEPKFQPIDNSAVSFPSKLNPETLIGTQLDPGEFTEALRNLHSTLKSMMALHCRTPGGREQELKRNKDTVRLPGVTALKNRGLLVKRRKI